MKSQTHSFETEWQSLQTSFRIWGITRTWIVFCNFFESYQPTSMDLQISKVGNYLILQLKCFVNHTSDSIKDNTKFHCIKTLFVPLFVDEVSFYKKSNLIAAINHTRPLNRGHYPVFIKQPNSSSRLFFNDAAIFRSSVEKIIFIHIFAFMKSF